MVKPFTKGVTSAMCHANLVTSRNVWDAVRLLGANYPLLATDNSEEAILTAFETVKSAWGTKTWEHIKHAGEKQITHFISRGSGAEQPGVACRAGLQQTYTDLISRVCGAARETLHITELSVCFSFA